MGSLADGLLNAGLVTEEKVAKHVDSKGQVEASKSKQEQSKFVRKSHKPVNIDQLDVAESVSAFRRAVLDILLVHTDVISDVIEKVHRFQDKPGGKKLVWQMYQVRDGLKKISKEDQKGRELFLRRGLRKSGATFDIPKQ